MTASESNYFEAIVVLKNCDEQQPVDACATWFKERGFRILPMVAGFLLVGDLAVFERTFGESENWLGRNLDIPDALVDDVTEISIHQAKFF